MYQYGAALYTDGEITGIERVPCGQRRNKYEQYKCSICGKPLYKPAGGGGEQNCDTDGRYKVTTEPTCTKAGIQTATCSYCGKVYTKTVSALGHDYKNVDAKDPTCTEPGNTAGKKCKRCGHMHSGEELPALGHIWSESTYSWSADLSACTASRVCARGHVETETAKAAVETTGNACVGGFTTYSVTFTNPGFVAQSNTVVFDDVGHSEEIIPGVAATCVKTGLSEGKICSVCGKILVEQKETTDKDPNNHEGPFVLGLNADVPSTCTTPGYHTEGICKACGVEVKTELPLDPDNHVVVVLNAVPATCTQTGLTEGTKCAECGEVFSGLEETPIDPNNHDWDEWVVTTEPTCTDSGAETRICKREDCVVNEKREVAALGHDWGEASYEWTANNSRCTGTCECKRCHKVETQAQLVDYLNGNSTATCEQDGLITGTARFTAPFKPQNATTSRDALGHLWGELVIITEPTCTETGVSTRTCKREGCGKTETVETRAKGHTGGTATCTAQAVCTRCNQPYGEALGHNWGAATYTWSADYSQCSAERECGRCHKGENATADALASGTPATCEQAGKTTYTATFSDPFTTQTVSKETPAQGHTGGTATCTERAVCTRCNQPYGGVPGHDPVHHEPQAPTCTAPGWDAYDTCSRCNFTTTYAETPALGHDWGEWTQTKAPNCTDPGEQTRTCQRAGCGATETGEIPAVEGAHVAVVDPAVAATCVEEGKTEGSHCSVCGKVLVEQTATEKNPDNHAALERIDAEPATCDEPGYAGTLVCKACKLDGDYTFISEGDIIPALGHEYNDEGFCARCGKQKEQEGVSGGNS